MSTAITQKGQVTIPKKVRDALGLMPGVRVNIEVDGRGAARIVPEAPSPERFARFLGAHRRDDGLSTDEYMQLMAEDD